jgi:protocatechuate 4,5-dioxygenase beta chain
MGELVAAIAMTHNPRIFWNAGAADAHHSAEVFGLFAELRRRLAESRPDRLIVLSNDHLDNFFLDSMPPFCVGLGSHASGPFWYESEVMHIPAYRAELDPELAADLLEVGVESRIDFAQAHEFVLDHAFCVPLSQLRPEMDLPVVPVFTNVFAYPLPSERRYFEVGQAIRNLIRNRPRHERIAFVSTFNLSVDVGGPKMGQRDVDFDREALELMRAGRAEAILRRLPVERMVAAGNSTPEFLNYCATLGVVEERPPDFLEYRLVPGWGGCPAVSWNLSDG